MNCPKCKMENADDATYCAFCYEQTRGKSAADTYIRAMQRVREEEASGQRLPYVATDDPNAQVPQHKPPKSVPFSFYVARASKMAGAFFVRFWRVLILSAIGLLLLLFIENSLNPVVRFRYLGSNLAYAFSSQTPTSYIFGTNADVRRWSERAGQMDTPLGDLKIQDVATVDVNVTRHDKQSSTSLSVTSNNWLLTNYRKKGLDSHTFSAKSGLLGPAYFRLDNHGHVTHVQEGSSIRMAKSAAFVAPIFPAGRLREKSTWTDQAQWVDVLDEWSVDWSVQRHWRVDSASQCGDDFCLQLHYDAVLTPRMMHEPSWMAGTTWQPAAVNGAGDVLFNVTQHQVISHHLDYTAVLRASIPDVARIPKTLRVGRRAFHAHGEIIFDLKNSASLQRN